MDEVTLQPLVMVDGCFDPLHEGHIEYFREAAAFGLKLVCTIQSDEYILSVKKRRSLLNQQQRLRIISSIRYIHSALIVEKSTSNMLRKIKPTIYFKGKDWMERGLPESELRICEDMGIQVSYGKKTLNSSSSIINSYRAKR